MADIVVGIGILGPVMLGGARGSVALAGIRQKALLVRLVIAKGSTVGTWQLRHDVWDGRHKSDAALRVAIGRLRSLLAEAGAPESIVHDGTGYRLDPEYVDVDADRFVSLLGEARSTIDSDPRASVGALSKALSIWRGPAFGELADEHFVTAEYERLMGLRDDAVELRLDALVRLGNRGLVPELEAAVGEAPLREHRTALLMRALYREGRQTDALAAYRRLEAVLRDDLGLSPGPELRRLERQILTHDPELSPTGAAPPGLPPATIADDVHAVLGQARSARALARAGVAVESARIADAAVAAARPLGTATLAECLVTAAQARALAGRAGEAVTALDEAVTLARADGNPRILANAALARFGFGLEDGDGLLMLLTEPLELMAVHEPERVDLLCAAMHQMALRGSADGAARLLSHAEAVATVQGTPRSHALVLAGRAVLTGLACSDLAAVRSAADVAAAAAEASGDPTLMVAALHSVFRAALEAGDLDGLEAARRQLSVVATASLFPFAVVRVGLLDVSQRLARGDLRGLEQRLDEVMSLGRAVGVASVTGTTGAQRALLALERAQFRELELLAAAMPGDNAVWTAVRAVARAETGQVSDALVLAGEALDRGSNGEGELSRDDAMIAACLVAEVAIVAGDAELARRATAHLQAWQGRFVVVAHATVTIGPVDRLLGLSALLDADVHGAVARLGAAVDLAAQSPLWRARCGLGLAAALRARGAAGDHSQADRLVEEARAEARRGASGEGSAWLAVQLDRVGASTSTST